MSKKKKRMVDGLTEGLQQGMGYVDGKNIDVHVTNISTHDDKQQLTAPEVEPEQARKIRQQFLADLDVIGDNGYDDEMDNFPLSPDAKAAREQRNKAVVERGYPMTPEEIRAAVLADREASERYYLAATERETENGAAETAYLESIPGMVESINAAAAVPFSECVPLEHIDDTAFLRSYGLDITNNDPEDNPADAGLIPPEHQQEK